MCGKFATGRNLHCLNACARRAWRTFALSDDAAHVRVAPKAAAATPMQNSMWGDGAAARAPTAAACSMMMASTMAASSARPGRPCPVGATGPEHPKLAPTPHLETTLTHHNTQASSVKVSPTVHVQTLQFASVPLNQMVCITLITVFLS